MEYEISIGVFVGVHHHISGYSGGFCSTYLRGVLRLFGWPDARCYYKPPNILVCGELMEVANSNGSSYSDGVGIEYQQTLAL